MQSISFSFPISLLLAIMVCVCYANDPVLGGHDPTQPNLYPPQGNIPQGYPPQGNPPQGTPPQGYPYPPQGYPPSPPSPPVKSPTESLKEDEILNEVSKSRLEMQKSFHSVDGKIEILSQNINKVSKDSTDKMNSNDIKISGLQTEVQTSSSNIFSTLSSVRDSLVTSFDKSGKNQKDILEAIAKISSIVNSQSKSQDEQKVKDNDSRTKILEKLSSLELHMKKMNTQLANVVENQKSAQNSTFMDSVSDFVWQWSATAKNLSLDMAHVVQEHGGEFWKVGKKKKHRSRVETL